MQSRIQKYFVDGNPEELRKSFDITVTDAEKRAGADHVVAGAEAEADSRGADASRLVDRSLVAAAHGDAHDVCRRRDEADDAGGRGA